MSVSETGLKGQPTAALWRHLARVPQELDRNYFDLPVILSRVAWYRRMFQ